MSVAARKEALRAALGGMLALAAAMGAGRFVYTPILPVMVEQAGISTAEAGYVASANFLGYLAGALVAATPALRGSRRLWLLVGLGANAFCLAAMAAVSGLSAFLVLRFLAGVASAFALVFSTSLVLDRLAESGRHGLSALHFSGVGIGIALTAAVTAAGLGAGLDWRGLWLASAVLSLAAWGAVAALVPAERPARAAATSAPAGDVRGALRLLTAAYGLYGFGYVVTATFLVAIVRADPATARFEAMVWILVGLTAAPSVALWSGIGRRIGVLRAFALACVVEALGVAASVAGLGLSGLVLAAVLLGGTFMGLVALGLVAARQITTGDPRRALAGMTAAFGAGQIVGPTAAGLAFGAMGDFRLATLAAAVALVAAAGLALAARKG